MSLEVKTTRGALKVSSAEIRHAFVNNAQLLGFRRGQEDGSPYGGGAKRSQRGRGGALGKASGRALIPFGPRMFCEANPAGLHALVHFLLTRLDARHYARLFETCWPLYDNRQVRAFRKLVLAELRAFEKEGYLPRGLAQASVLTSAQGARADRLVWHLSAHVLREVLARDHGQQEELSLIPESGPASDYPGETTNRQKVRLRRLIRAAEAQVAYREQEFRDKVGRALSTKQAMKDKAEELTSDFREFEAHKALLSERLVNVVHTSPGAGAGAGAGGGKTRKGGGAASASASASTSAVARDVPAIEMLTQQWNENAERLESEVRVGWERLNASASIRTAGGARDAGVTMTAAEILQASANRREVFSVLGGGEDVVDGSVLARAVQKEESAARCGDKDALAPAPAPVDIVDAIHHSVRSLETLGQQFLGHPILVGGAHKPEISDALALPMRGLGDLDKLEKLAAIHDSYLEQSKGLLQRLRASVPELQTSVAALATQADDTDTDVDGTGDTSVCGNSGGAIAPSSSSSSSSTSPTSAARSNVSIRMTKKGASAKNRNVGELKSRVTGKKFHQSSPRSGSPRRGNTPQFHSAQGATSTALAATSTEAATSPHATSDITPVPDSYDLPSIKAQLASLRKRLETKMPATLSDDAPVAPAAPAPSPAPAPLPAASPRVVRTTSSTEETTSTPAMELVNASKAETPAWKAQTPVTYSSGRRPRERGLSAGDAAATKKFDLTTPSKQLDFAVPPRRAEPASSIIAMHITPEPRALRAPPLKYATVAAPVLNTTPIVPAAMTPTMPAATTSGAQQVASAQRAETTEASQESPTALFAGLFPGTKTGAIPQAPAGGSDTVPASSESIRRKQLRKQARMAVRTSPMSSYSPNPLRAELMRLISALHRHGAISSDVRGSLKDELIAAKTMTQLRALHEKITLDVGDSVVPKPKAAKTPNTLVVPDINVLLGR
jgi:hypothetical protein